MAASAFVPAAQLAAYRPSPFRSGRGYIAIDRSAPMRRPAPSAADQGQRWHVCHSLRTLVTCSCAAAVKSCHAPSPSPAMRACSSGQARGHANENRRCLPWTKSQRWQKIYRAATGIPRNVQKCRYPRRRISWRWVLSCGQFVHQLKRVNRFRLQGPSNAMASNDTPTLGKAAAAASFRALTNARRTWWSPSDGDWKSASFARWIRIDMDDVDSARASWRGGAR